MVSTIDQSVGNGVFQALIQEHYDGLSKRLKQLARYLLENPERLALCTVAELAGEADVPPSTVIRLANALGFGGFSEMRREIRSQLHYTGSYTDRVQAAHPESAQQGTLSPLIEKSRGSLQVLEQSINKKDLLRAVSLIQQADTIYVMGVRRAHPVATYLAYGLWQLDRRCVLLGGKGGLHQEEAAGIRRTDLVFLISYYPYGEETLWMQEHARMREARLITLTDNEVSPLAKDADLALFVRDAEVGGVRGLSTSMCLAQGLILSLAKN
ncbi:MurR/RpiR family transcriptional regulator [Endozoicomonas elysicola]|uniref:MurR/RpiR family transcriptional regulator n=1 Tax=Endozoicomonas elysicola TaxID=305900 RepID=UPI0003622E33|nr:MurR/RpiR family transcriptional regulator [Endozoicomonas elysicola]